jgi:UDP-N-acetylmuramoyl-L-alanyl-D-glutamate--2,6-diaminopimelate ligase
MKLQHLFSTIPGIPGHVLPDIEVSGIFNDARKVIQDGLFVAIRGVKVDGHTFIPDAISKGAQVLVVEDANQVPNSFKGFVLRVENTREALDILASHYYGDPAEELFCVGVTGTNGKTSVTYMVESILNHAKLHTGVIGTVNHHLLEKVWPSDMTTPDPIYLQKRLKEFKDDGAKAVAMEVSSHALDQHRVDSVPFNTVIFTNLTRDHLDYHETMEKYFESKQRLFTDLLWQTDKAPCFAIVNIDDKYGRKLHVADPAVLWSYGADKGADLCFKIKEMDFALTKFDLKTPVGTVQVELPMSGTHNVMNAVAAIGAGLSAKIPLETCVEAINKFTGVPGRLQAVPNNKDLSVFVDYAHSPDALENVLTALNKVRESLKSDAKIWTVFGCGGDRDKGKRPLMAEMALRFSDYVVVTSDNPRTEDPQTIIDDIVKGIEAHDEKRVTVLVDRKAAIDQTIREANPGDVILIAGKGHEDYQIIGTTKFPFSDVQVAEQALQGRV